MARGANKFVRRGLDFLQDVLEVVSEVLMGLGAQAKHRGAPNKVPLTIGLSPLSRSAKSETRVCLTSRPRNYMPASSPHWPRRRT